ncbi:unnamed protein product [Rotaria sordida]|uniref:Uncharacterized protein n=1 Tax=Rotaria sordida TaxID=392033 RepID=A0A814E5G3_9BILA|nr:unnamed protein product [Rotaria sordida]
MPWYMLFLAVIIASIFLLPNAIMKAVTNLGHYMKIPPRIMFATQTVATIVADFVKFLTTIYLINTVPNICTMKNIEWTCPSLTSLYSGSVIWGAVGN